MAALSASIASIGVRATGSTSTRDGDELIVLFTGGTKKRQQADVDRARALLAEYKARKAAAAGAKRKR